MSSGRDISSLLKDLYAEPFIIKDNRKHGLLEFHATRDIEVVGPVSGKVRAMKPGDVMHVDHPLMHHRGGVFIEKRCSYCRSVKVSGKAHCPNCGGNY